MMEWWVIMQTISDERHECGDGASHDGVVGVLLMQTMSDEGLSVVMVPVS